jgi:hypothetical protein
MPSTQKLYRISNAAMSEVEEALKGYYAAVESSDLSQSSQASYIDMANNFVRWLRIDFIPGSRKAPYRVRDTKLAANARDKSSS